MIFSAIRCALPRPVNPDGVVTSGGVRILPLFLWKIVSGATGCWLCYSCCVARIAATTAPVRRGLHWRHTSPRGVVGGSLDGKISAGIVCR